MDKTLFLAVSGGTDSDSHSSDILSLYSVMDEGTWHQKFTIHYNCVGVIEVPDLNEVPNTDVAIKTRKGVVLSYGSGGNSETRKVECA